jgi:hypothetical protein
MRRRIERVVDRHARARTKRPVRFDDRCASAIGEDAVVARDEHAEWIARRSEHALERRRRIDVPKGDERARTPVREHGRLEQLIEHSDAARLDDEVCVRCLT